MACTTQSALVYVKNARTRLLGKLKNLSVILENLRQKEVFSDEAVSKIQAEKDDYDKTRKILDWVKCMGEEACYEFLRIVDITRQRTLEADLHHWISCFPFREDTEMDTKYLQGPKPCHRYQAKLKLKARKTSNEFWTANKNLFKENNKPHLSYMSLVLDTQGSVSPSKIKKLKIKKSKMIRPKKLRTYVPEDKVGTSPGDLLKTHQDVLVVGKPGIGKTALTQEMLRLWEQRDNEKLDYMFYFDMRETSHIRKALSLEDLLFIVFSEPDEGKEEVLQDIKDNSDNVTLIFDGITDLSSSVVKKLVDKDLLPDAKIIVTCRPDDEEEFSSEDFLRVEVKGFSEQTIKTYLSVMLGEEQKKVLSNMELFTLCHVPVYALMVAACFSFEAPVDSPQPCTITEIYINIVRFCLQRNSNNPKTKDPNPFIKNKRKEILSLAEAAFNATEGKTVNLTELPCEDSCVLSFLKPLFTKVGPTKTKTTYAFLHYTMQEFFAALWLLKNPDKIKDVFQQCLTDERKHMKHLIPFMCCLLTEKSPSLTKCLIPAEELKNTSDWFFKEMITTIFTCTCEADTEDSGPDVDILFLCQCLYESQCPEACIHLLDKLDYHLDLSGESLDPLPCCAVAYVVNQSEERKVSLNLEDVRVSDQGMRRLFGCLQNVQRVTCRGPGLQDQKQQHGILERKEKQLLLDLCLTAARHKGESFHNVVNTLRSLFSVNTDMHDILLDFYQHVKSGGFLSVIPLKSVFQSAPAVWIIDLSKRKTSILLEVLKLQSEKKRVELRGWSDEESEVRSFLQCVPYISQLRFCPRWIDSGAVKVCGNLFCAAAEREQQTGEKILELLSSLCSYQRFPLSDWYDDDDDDDVEYQSGFLLDLCSHLKDYETQTGLSVLPSVQSVFQSAPAVWVIDLSKRKPSILLEVLKLQSEKKQVELRGWSDEESEVRSFLQCVPYISQLSCGPEFFQRVCTLISVRSREEAEQLASLLQLLGFTLLLTGELHLNTCRTVGRVLVLCGSEVNLTLTPQKISVRGASVLFRRATRLHSLRLSNDMALLLCRWVRRGRVDCLLTVEELSLSPQKVKPSDRVLLRVVSNVASLLRFWTVRRLDLTEFSVPAQGLIPLLLHDGPLTVKLSQEIFQQLLFLLHEIQDKDLTQLFLTKVGGDLTSCRLNWELLHYLLQQSSSQTVTVNLRKNSFLQRSITRLLPFLDRIVFKRLSPSFVLAAIREIYDARASPIIPSLLRSFDHVINLNCREMDSVDCAALLFTLRHSVRVKLNLVWSSIPAGETESILFTLDRVSQLSVDRNLLLRLVHRCAASDVQQWAAVDLLRTVQHRLDLSCSSCVELDQREPLSLTADDCRAVSAILRHSSQDTQVILQDCQVEDSGLDLLFPVLYRVRLRASKAVLLQLVSLVPVNSEWDTVSRAASLCRALGGELDFSHSTLDQRACGALALMLDWCEELTELDLSHCRLTDQLLLTLSAHLHKVQVLDLSHNNITDASTGTLLQLVSTNPSIHTVRLFGNKIVNRTCFDKHKFEIW